jgi:uncharacterized protein with NRDE domain
MCTVLILRGVVPGLPVVLAANRDEFYGRPTLGPGVLLESPRAVGGRDQVRAGTWLGVTPAGLVVGVTNYRAGIPPDPAKRSRGQLVLDALARPTVEDLLEFVIGLDAREFNPFNLLFGDAGGLHVAYGRSEQARVEVQEVPAGVHVLPTDRLDSPSVPKVAGLRERARAACVGSWEELQAGLQSLMADHELPPGRTPRNADLPAQVEAVCVHTELYGTRSTSVVALVPGGVARYLHADGAPCQAPLEDATHLLSDSPARS